MSGVTEAADGHHMLGDDAPVLGTSLCDSELHAALVDRDPAASDKLVDHFGSLMVAFAEGRRSAGVDAAVSAVLLSMLREPKGWPTDELSMRAALLRSLRLRLLSDDVEGVDRLATSAESGGDAADVLLAALDVEQRDLILLRTVCGLGLRQVAVVLDRPIHSVKSLQRHAVTALSHAVGHEVETASRGDVDSAATL